MAARLTRLTEAATRAAIERYAEALVAEAPPLTDEIRQELRVLLNPPPPRLRTAPPPVRRAEHRAA